MMWDTGGWKLNRENPDIRLHRAQVRRDRLARYLRAAGARPQRCRAPTPGSTSPCARRSRRASRSSVGNFTAAQGTEDLVDPRMQAQFTASFPDGPQEHPLVSGDPAGPRGDRGPRPRSRQGRAIEHLRHEHPGPGRRAAESSGLPTIAPSTQLSFSVARGSFFSILGPSGCGKTTLLRMIAGFIEPDSGDILIGGRSMHGVAPNRRPVNMVFQQLALFPMMSVGENVAFGLARRGVAQRRAPASARRPCSSASAWPARRDKRVDELSGGQRQRVAIARSLVLEPTLLLLDEPLGALDLKLREHMKIELKQLQAAFGTTFVYITHDQSEALVLSDHVGGHESRPLRAARHAAGAVLPAGHGVRGRLRRRQQSHRRPSHGARRRAGRARDGRRLGGARTRSGGCNVGDAAAAFVRPGGGDPRARMPSGCRRDHLQLAAARCRACCSTAPTPRCCCASERSGFEFRIALPQTGRFADLKVGERMYFGFDPQRAICFAAARSRMPDATAAGLAPPPDAGAAARAGAAVAVAADRPAARRSGAAVVARAHRAARLSSRASPQYRTFFTEPLYWHVFVRTALMSALATALTLLIAFPDRLDHHQGGARPRQRAAVRACA